MNMTHFPCLASIVVGLGGCFSPNQAVTGDGSASDQSTTATEGSGTSSTMTATTASTGPTNTTDATQGDATRGTDPTSGTETAETVDTSAGSTDDGGPLCGNGMMDGAEACDDGDEVNGNGCNNDCVESGMVLWEVDVSDGYDAVTTAYGGNDRVVADSSGAAFVVFEAEAADFFAVIRKLDDQGTFQWTVEAENPTPGRGVFAGGIAATPAGEVVLTGIIEDDSQLDENAFLNRYDAQGSLSWANVLDPGFQNAGNGVALDEDGVSIVAGSAGAAGGFVWKYDSNGTSTLTEYYVPAGGFAHFFGAAANVGGDFVVVGDAGVGDGDVWVRRFTANAVEIWTETYAGGGASEEGASAVAITPDGGAVVIGTADANVWLRKYSAAGGIEWTQTHNGAADGNDDGFAVAALANGDVVVAGREEAAGGDFDVWTSRRAGADGAELWSRAWDGGAGEDDGAAGVAIAAGGDVLVSSSIGSAPVVVRLNRLTE